MKCPQCSNIDTRITDSRLSRDDMIVRRRRICEKCQYRFTTAETREVLDVMVVKKSGIKERYSTEKLLKAVSISLHKRPFTQDKIRDFIIKLEVDLFKKDPKEISTKQIGDTVLKHLKVFDEVAYIRFASIYRDFRTIKGFRHEIDKLLQD